MKKEQRQRWEYKFNVVRDGEKVTDVELEVIAELMGQFVVSHILEEPYADARELEVENGLYGNTYYFDTPELDYDVRLNVIPSNIPELPEYTTLVDDEPRKFQAIRTLGSNVLQAYLINEGEWLANLDQAHQFDGPLGNAIDSYCLQTFTHLTGKSPEPHKDKYVTQSLRRHEIDIKRIRNKEAASCASRKMSSYDISASNQDFCDMWQRLQNNEPWF